MKTAITSAAKTRGLTNRPVDPSPNGLPRETYLLLETAALVGAASGIAVGAIGGPPGAIVGGILGTAVGMMAGSTLDVAEKREAAHDRELDDTIGVTEGDLGARESALEGLKAANEGLLVLDRDLGSTSELLRDEHVHLEQVYEMVLNAYRAGDWNYVAASWNVFEAALRAHMEAEERHVFPRFMGASPAEAHQLLAEHDELRSMLETLGVNIELHAVPGTVAEELIRRLREHGEHEERVLYPWLEAAFDGAPLHKPSSRGE